LELGIDRDLFWNSTFAACWDWFRAHRQRVQREREHAAWIVLTVRQVNGDKTTTLDKLMGRKPKRRKAVPGQGASEGDRLAGMLDRLIQKQPHR
jgi:hypothetical protein